MASLSPAIRVGRRSSSMVLPTSSVNDQAPGTASPIPRFAAARGEQGGRAERETAAEEGAARQWSGHDG